MPVEPVHLRALLPVVEPAGSDRCALVDSAGLSLNDALSAPGRPASFLVASCRGLHPHLQALSPSVRAEWTRSATAACALPYLAVSLYPRILICSPR